MGRRLRSNVLAVSFNKKELSEVEGRLKTLIEKANKNVSYNVATRVANDINASGNVPFDTGNLKNDRTVFKDKYDTNFAVIGWFAPYARKLYYGVGGESIFKTIDGKRRSFKTNSTGNGIPFWDKPFTRNTSYMIRIYEWAYRKEELGK